MRQLTTITSIATNKTLTVNICRQINCLTDRFWDWADMPLISVTNIAILHASTEVLSSIVTVKKK
jgi:hypothetical protein